MRIVELSGPDGRRLSLHPRVAVVPLGPGADRMRLVAALAALVQGEPTGEAVIDVHGIRLRPRADQLAALGLGPHIPSPVVRSTDVPTLPGPTFRRLTAARHALERARAAEAAAEAALAEARRRREDQGAGAPPAPPAPTSGPGPGSPSGAAPGAVPGGGSPPEVPATTDGDGGDGVPDTEVPDTVAAPSVGAAPGRPRPEGPEWTGGAGGTGGDEDLPSGAVPGPARTVDPGWADRLLVAARRRLEAVLAPLAGEIDGLERRIAELEVVPGPPSAPDRTVTAEVTGPTGSAGATETTEATEASGATGFSGATEIAGATGEPGDGGGSGGAAPDGRREPPTPEELESLRDRCRQLTEALEALEVPTPAVSDPEVLAALEAAMAEPETVLPDELAAEHRRLLEAVAAARAELAAATEEADRSRLDPEVIAELERVHEEVLEARERAERRFAGRRAQQRRAEAERAEAELLARLGFRTYAEFMLGASGGRGDVGSRLRLEAARRALAEAEAELADFERRHPAAGGRALAVAAVLDAAGIDAGDDPVATARSILEQAAVAEEVAAERARLAAELERAREAYEEAAVGLFAPDGGTDPGAGPHGSQPAVPPGSAPVVGEGRDPGGSAGREASPEAEGAASPGGEREASPEAEGAASPGGEREASPEAEGGASPGGEREASPEAEGAASPGGGREASPERWRLVELVHLGPAAELAAQLDELEADPSPVEPRAGDARVGAGPVVSPVGGPPGGPAPGGGREALGEPAPPGGPHGTAPPAPPGGAPDQAGTATTGGAGGEPAPSGTGDRFRVEAAVAAAERDLRRARRAVREAELEVASATEAHRRELEASLDEIIEEAAYELLARLSGQRRVGVVGSVPLVLDDPFGDLPAAATEELLARLARFGDLVQIIVVTDDPTVIRWATAHSPGTVGVAGPVPADAA